MNRWGDELTDYMKAAENKCRSFKQNYIEYSPDVNIWWKRRWLLERIRRYIQGKVPDPRNLFQDCKKADLDPRQVTAEMVDMEVFVTQKKLEELKLKSPEMRRQHLKSCM